MKKLYLIALATLFSTLIACSNSDEPDPLRRARADGINKEAFVCRYRDPQQCIDLSNKALSYISDSLPSYTAGIMRAYNNMAFAHYQLSDGDKAKQALQQVERTATIIRHGKNSNSEIECVIAKLIMARLLQRECRIADSYRLLYDIDRSGILDHPHDNLLQNYARAEYYITMLVLNYHYRNDKQADVRTLLAEVENGRQSLRVDYAEDMALNYALAYGWQSAGESLTALDYCEDNLLTLTLPGTFCRYHYANTLQMMALALKSMPGMVSADSVLSLYDEARSVFFDYGDPYQMLGGTTSTARYAMLIGDTASAHAVLNQWREATRTGSLWTPFSAPKMELGYFDAMIRSRYGSSPDEVRTWYERRSELENSIQQYEHEDFVLQQNLSNAQRRSRWMTHAAMLFAVMIALLIVLAVMLWLSLKRQRREKRLIEEAKRRDVERIANVETCLSVMRHDISPFIGYLSRPDLNDQLRDEVLQQLLRTFDNIKHWTRLSAPGGLTFHAADFALQEVLDDVQQQVMSPHDGVLLVFEPSPLRIRGDRLLLTIMLRNLVNNALQHTSHGHVTISAHSSSDDMVDIDVSDTGSGMDAEQRDSLFRADRSLPEGSEHGFGLILCRYIIGKHDDLTRRGCKLWVQSEPGIGTTVHCRLAAAPSSL